MISKIEKIHNNGSDVFVRAIVEDMVLIRHQTMEEPAEYGPALCEATFEIIADDIPEDEDDLMDYLEKIDLDWKVIENSNY